MGSNPLEGAPPPRSRWWVLRAFGHHPLVRSSDRVEAWLLALLVIAAVFAVPFALATATGVHDSRTHELALEPQTSHEVIATVVDDTVTAVRGYTLDVKATVAWTANNVEHTTKIDVAQQMSPGDEVRIWVDDAGKLTSPPETAATAVRDAVLAGVTVWAGVIGCAALLFVLVRMRLNGIRGAGWDRDLRHLVDDEGGRADWRN